jgi:hypothetical protein
MLYFDVVVNVQDVAWIIVACCRRHTHVLGCHELRAMTMIHYGQLLPTCRHHRQTVEPTLTTTTELTAIPHARRVISIAHPKELEVTISVFFTNEDNECSLRVFARLAACFPTTPVCA